MEKTPNTASVITSWIVFNWAAGVLIGTDTIGRYLKTVLEGRNQPADENCFPEWGLSEFQMSVPGKRHENVGNAEKNYGSHREASCPK